MKKRVRYGLSILAPGDDPEKELMRVTSDKPFQAVRVGDEVLPRRWLTGRDAPEQTLAGTLLRVVKVRHEVCVWNDLIGHLTVVFTEDASPVRSARSARPTNPTNPRRPRAV